AELLGPIQSAPGKPLGETHEGRWDLSGRPGTATTLYYHVGPLFYRQDALVGPASAEILHDFLSPIVPTAEMAPSDDARYWALRLADGRCVVYDMERGDILPGWIEQRPNALDISPAGQWFAVLEHTHHDPTRGPRL